jgi:hypothetical protein
MLCFALAIQNLNPLCFASALHCSALPLHCSSLINMATTVHGFSLPLLSIQNITITVRTKHLTAAAELDLAIPWPNTALPILALSSLRITAPSFTLTEPSFTMAERSHSLP